MSRPAAYITTPLGMGFGYLRGPIRIFRLLRRLQSCNRDRFEGIQDRVLDDTEIGDWAVTEVTAAACRRSQPQDLGPVSMAPRRPRSDFSVNGH